MKLATPRQGVSPAALVALASGNMKYFMAATMEGGIEAQEKAGQMEQAERSTLPLELGSKYQGTPAEHRKPWEALGFKVSDRIVDDIFVEVEFPKGWKKVPTDHSMWSKIVDDKGRERGTIFYKAALYDRSAHAHLNPRFGVGQTYADDKTATESVFVIDACGKVERRYDGFAKPDYSKDRATASANYDKIELAKKEMWAWLKETYPDCESPTAYWED